MLKEPLVIQDFKVLKVPKERLVFKDKQVTHKVLLDLLVFRDLEVVKVLQSRDRQVTLKVLPVVQDFKELRVPKERLVFKDKQENLKALQVTQDFKVFKVFKVLQSKVKLVNPKVLLVLPVFKDSKEVLVLKEHLVFKDKQVMHKDFRVCKDYKV